MKRIIISVLVGLLIGAFFIFGFLFFDAEPVYAYELSPEERELIARVTLAEAEGESELGKRLVIDTILNRVDHESFPDSVEEVIFQKGQYTTPSKRLDENILYLVLLEEKNKINNKVIFFNRGNYPKYGDPVLKEGKHYFSTVKGCD